MSLIAAALVLALTRAEIIDRFNAVPVTKLDGLVRVYGNCPADMRREFQMPIASFTSGICRKLYSGGKVRQRRFAEPGIVISIGDVRTNIAEVVARQLVRADGSKFTRIYVPSPAGADLRQFRLAVVRAFYRALDGEDIDDDEALRRFREADPETRAADIEADVAAWRERGVYSDGRTDDDYLKLMRGVHLPGVATKADVLTFASRLYLYPSFYAYPFCGKWRCCSFREAIALARKDPTVRLAAYDKMQGLAIFGAGHGDRMTAAVESYVKFLMELTALKMSDEELASLLDEADGKLKGALEQ